MTDIEIEFGEGAVKSLSEISFIHPELPEGWWERTNFKSICIANIVVEELEAGLRGGKLLMQREGRKGFMCLQ